MSALDFRKGREFERELIIEWLRWMNYWSVSDSIHRKDHLRSDDE